MMKGRILFIFIAIIFLAAFEVEADTFSVADLPAHKMTAQFQRDTSFLKAYVANIEKTMNLIEENNTLFSRERKKDFTIREKQKLYTLWGNFLDYLIALDGLTTYYRKFYVIRDREIRNRAFLLAYASYITKFSKGLRFISRTIGNELYEKKLDDINSEYGIPGGMYAALKWNTIHVQDVTTVLAGYQYHRFLGKSYKEQGLVDDKKTGWLFGLIESEYKYIKKELKIKGAQYFISNGLDIVKDRTFSAWFPVQKSVSDWMGNTKVKRINRYLIKDKQIEEMDRALQPGDIIVARRNWYLSNIGLPGFWPHAELYIGTLQEMKDFFADNSVTGYYRSIGEYKDFMDYLEKEYPERMKRLLKNAHDGYPHQVIEAVSEGVTFSSLQEATSADYIGVMRPRLSKLDIARAIDEAFQYLGRPYDFNFDFLTDSTIVCSELIYKIYLRGEQKKGLDLRLRELAGRQVVPPNDIVAKFDNELGTPSQKLDFVYFLDGSEEEKKAVVKGISEFRKSHERLKWDIAQK
jgi:hypothetical protein